MIDSIILYSFSMIFFPNLVYLNLDVDDLNSYLYRHIEYQFQSNITIGVQSPVLWHMRGKIYGGVSTIQVPATTKNRKFQSVPLSVNYDINIEVVLMDWLSVGWSHQCLHPIATQDHNKGVPGVPHKSSDRIFIKVSNF